LCDDVVILHRGRVVLAGELEALRRGSDHRRVEVAFADEDRGRSS
jgi:ABC-type Na+ transport system ATPase subunit NatA